MQMQCIKCGETKPVDAFPTRSSAMRRKDCRDCYNTVRRSRRTPKERTLRIERICPQCKKATLKTIWQIRAQNFCTFDCRVAWQRSRPGRPCSVEGDIALVPLCRRDGTVRAYAIIDASDAEWVGQWCWSVSGHYAGRREVTEDNRVLTVFLHRELLGLPRVSDGRLGDHIDRDSLNCRRHNLRVVTRFENAQNKTKWQRSASDHRGVTARRNGKWVARVHVDGRTQHLGTFPTEIEAAMVARKARLRFMSGAVD